MKRKGFTAWIRLGSLLRILGALLLVVCFSRASARQEAQNAVDAGTRDNYSAALDLLFQDRCATPTDARWVSCVRIVPGHPDELEYALSLEKRFDGTILARITRPKRHSIHAQLSELKKQHPHASVSDLTRLIEVESKGFDQQSLPGLVRFADEFEKIRFPLVRFDEIIMDATQYRLRVRSFSGDQEELTLQGPGSAAPHQPQPLIQWAESVKAMLASAFTAAHG